RLAAPLERDDHDQLRRSRRRPVAHHPGGDVERRQGAAAAGGLPVRTDGMTIGRRGARGHTLVEMMVVLSTMTLVFAGLFMLLRPARDASHEAISRSTLQEAGRRMLEVMLDDLRHTGLTTSGGQNLPAIWEHARGVDSTPPGPLVATMNYTDVYLVN